ncbi:unnamed protein product [Rhizoctonia solani]|uniref:Transmembrane protein n=1 Tax=Rhizoctonia solani TaxID=456999 RepID=A0A8H3A5U6_9AGAM|nr:unnamed protein product [Rhizoctonia solani]
MSNSCIFLESHMRRSLPENMSQNSSGLSGSFVTSSSRSSRKQVTWGQPSKAKNPVFPAARQKVHSTLGYLKDRLRQVESERNIGVFFKRRRTRNYKVLQGILKPPTARFPEDRTYSYFDWTQLHDEPIVYAADSMDAPSLDTPSDITEDTPTESMTSTPPEPISPCDSWDNNSEYWSDQWDETPRLPNEWCPPLDYLMESRLEVGSESEISDATNPVQILHQPVEGIQTPAEFIEELTSSLQYGLIVCSLGLMAFLFLAFWTTLLITCGVMVASMFPVALAAYGFILLFTRTKCSVEWLLMTTLKIWGGLTLAIGIVLVIIVDYIGDTAFALCANLMAILPSIVLLGALSIALFSELPGGNSFPNALTNSTYYLM